MPSFKISWGKNINKNEQISSHLVYNIVSLGKMAGKTEPFPWRPVEYELVAKYLDNLATEKIYCYFKWVELKAHSKVWGNFWQMKAL